MGTPIADPVTAGGRTDPPDAAVGSPSPPPERTGRVRRHREDPASDRNLRSMISSRPTQLSPTLAMRAREVAIPTADDLAAADRDLVLVRRNYVPPTPLSSGSRVGRRSAGHGSRAGRTRRQDGSSGAVGADS